MGTTRLNIDATKVRLKDEQRQHIAALVGLNRMTAFIREAIENELARREKQRSGRVSRTAATNRAGLAALRFPLRFGTGGVALGPSEALGFRQPDV